MATRRRRSGLSPEVRTLLVAVALVAGVIVCGAVVVVVATVPAARNVVAGKPKMTREEFISAVLHKSESEVIKAIGKPKNTQGGSGRDSYWYYEYKTYDPASGKVDSSAQVCFENGRVYSVNFQN